MKSPKFWLSYDLFSEEWFCDFGRSLERCNSASSEAIFNFSKDLKSPVHALFTIYYNKFGFNQVFRSKTPCGFAYRADFCRFLCVWHRSWRGEAVATVKQLSPHPRPHLPPPPPTATQPPTWMWAKMRQPWEMVYTNSRVFYDFGLFWGINWGFLRGT